MFRVLVSDPLAESGIEILRRAPGIDVDVKTGLTPEELLSIIGGYDALAVRSEDKGNCTDIGSGQQAEDYRSSGGGR